MNQIIKEKRGLRADLPSSANLGEFLYVIDTGEIFIGNGAGNSLTQIKHKDNLDAVTNPTVNDDITLWYTVGSTWVNTALDLTFVCVDNTDGAAVWKQSNTISVEASTNDGFIKINGTETRVSTNHTNSTSDPGVSDDLAHGQLKGSRWENTTTKDYFVCIDNTNGAAVWKLVNTIKNKYNATVNPTATDDNTLGYSVGSVWLNTSTSTLYECISSATNAAVWKNVNMYYNNYSATTNPTVDNDNTQGYHIGSLWVNTSNYTLFECFSAVTGAAYWRNVHTNLNNYTASTDPTINNDTTQGYVPGSEWFNTSSGNMFQCLTNGTGAAVWKQVNNVRNNFSATTNPGVNNDGTQGYSIGSMWVNTISQTVYECMATTTGAAVWKLIDTVKNNYTATIDPTVNNDGTQGYAVGSVWINTTNKTYFVCTSSSTGAATWVTPINSSLFYGTISGCRLIYRSGSEVDIDYGAIHVGTNFLSKSSVTTIDFVNNLDTGTVKAANTWYYVYLEQSGISFVGFISSQAPTRDTFGNTVFPWEKRGKYHPTRTARFVGSIYTDANQNIIPFKILDSYVSYLGQGTNYLIQNVSTNSLKVPLSCAAKVPKTSQFVNIVYSASDNNGLRQIGDIDSWTLVGTRSLAGSTAMPLTNFNLAANKTATASTGGTPGRVDDGNTTTFWQATTTANQWVEIDLGSAQTVNSVRIMEYLSRITSFNVQYFNGSTWVNVVTGTTLGDLTWNKYTFADVSAQRWRIYINTSSALPGIREFNIFNKDVQDALYYYCDPTPSTVSIGVLGYFEEI